MSTNSSDFILSPGRIWIAPVGEAIPADTVMWGTVFGGNWTLVGETKDPVVVSYNFDTVDIVTQQLLTPVGRKKVKEALMVKTTLARFIAANLGLAMDGTVTNVTAATGIAYGKDTVDLGGKICLTEKQICVEALVTDDECAISLPMRLFVWRATISAGGDMTFGKDDYAGIPLEISALSQPSKPVGQQLCQWIRMIPKTSD